ncbi:hypothetical protein RHSIM_Rhsim06G0110800 [Rhododendron simsii]|uniref:Uncharacterized protein n=1 Tax=Rhododendron simsii TaxID=118357 RepID=A0A834GRU3_RHOSS|nr:hypothetical protein RHSIM_Rhsim06G0110800 [Rhododendron simsii]
MNLRFREIRVWTIDEWEDIDERFKSIGYLGLQRKPEREGNKMSPVVREKLRYQTGKRRSSGGGGCGVGETENFHGVILLLKRALLLIFKYSKYLERRSQHWSPNDSVHVKDIEEVNKMKMGLYVLHTINFQNYVEMSSSKSEFILEPKKKFEEFGIKYYNLLLQEVHLSCTGPAAPGIKICFAVMISLLA